MTNRSILALIVVLVLCVTSIGCGSGNHLVSIAVTPNPATIDSPGTVQLKAVGTFSNGTTEMLSPANWTSSSPDVTVNNQGLAACSLTGGPVVEVTITASAGSMGTVSGSTALFCSPPHP